MFHDGYALKRVHIDIVGPLRKIQKGKIHIGYSGSIHKFGEAVPLKNQLVETVAGVVVRELVARFGRCVSC